MKLHPHELLINIVISLTSSLSTIGAPLVVNGILKRKLNYIFKTSIIDEKNTTIFGKNFHPPDAFLKNNYKNIAITVECKSGINEDETNLDEQILFYSENDSYKDIFLSEEDTHEIIILIIPHILDQVIKIIEDLGISTNIVIWIAEETQEDMYFIKRRYGNHIDNDLEEIMSNGVLVNPPSNLMLISPNISHSGLISEISKRLLANAFTLEMNIDDFIARQSESIISYSKIKKVIKHVFTLIPELGELIENEIKFKKRPNFGEIWKKIEFISTLRKSEVSYLLRRGHMTQEDMEEIEEHRNGIKRIDEFL